jgi:arylsulfatase A-like enzyme
MTRHAGWTRLGVLLLACGLGCGEPERPTELSYPRTGLIIVSIDTLRADRLGAYGNSRGLTPNLDELAEDSVLFESCFSNSPKTASSHMSLFTSMLPTEHGVTNFSPRQNIPLITLADNRLTLGQILNRNKYWNFTIASGGNIQGAMGFQKGFKNQFRSINQPITETVEMALDMAKLGSRQGFPMFGFVHTYEVHGPYMPPIEYREEFAPNPSAIVGELVESLEGLTYAQQWKAMHEGLWDHKDRFTEDDARYLSELYDAEVAWADHVLGAFFTGLKRQGILDKVILVVLSDHGEEFAEHGSYEHDQLYREHLHVPLMIRLPDEVLGGTRVAGQCQLIDVMPTLLDLLDAQLPEDMQRMQGTSLVPAMLSGRTADTPLLAERVMYADDYQATWRSPAASLVFRAKEGTLEAYDLRADPDEQQDVAWSAPFFDKANGLFLTNLKKTYALRQALDQVATGTAATLSKDALQELEELGYLGDESAEADIEIPSGTPLERWPQADPR